MVLLYPFNIASSQKLILFVQILSQCAHNRTSIITGRNNVTIDYNYMCPKALDGMLCWDNTHLESHQSHSGNVLNFDPERFAFKICSDFGEWFYYPKGYELLTEYSTCIDEYDLQFQIMINEFYVGGYSISMITTLFALGIFLYFRSLRCLRVRIHINLFVTFILHNLSWILWNRLVMNDSSVILQNPYWCQAMHLITIYFMMANYFWIIVESLHLYIALTTKSFLDDEKVIRQFLLLGWGGPTIITMFYGIVRSNLHDGTSLCWIDSSGASWIISSSVVICLVSAMGILLVVVQIIRHKLVTARRGYTFMAMKKAVRIALILIPLLGINLLLIPIQPAPSMAGYKTYQVISVVVASLQGTVFSVLFCFTNHEILNIAKSCCATSEDQNEEIPMRSLARRAADKEI